jgi:hypothetical protein
MPEEKIKNKGTGSGVNACKVAAQKLGDDDQAPEP